MIYIKNQFKDLFEALFHAALRIRLVEERIAKIYPSDKIQSPVHLSIGQEAVAVGTCRSLRKDDLLFGTYRSHAFYLAKGGNLNEMMAELYGKVTGCGRGKAGSMHLLAPEVGFTLSSAVVSTTIPHAVGAALAAKIRGTDQVMVVAFGDGATEEGVYHESLNFAALHGLPVVFLCENNGLAIHSKLKARQAYSFVEHARSYGVAGSRFEEGYDFLGLHTTFEKIVERTRRERKPYFLEVETFRYREHVGPGEDFDQGYRSRKDLDSWRAKDPLETEEALVARFRPAIEEEIDAAVQFAEESPWPSADELLRHVL